MYEEDILVIVPALKRGVYLVFNQPLRPWEAVHSGRCKIVLRPLSNQYQCPEESFQITQSLSGVLGQEHRREEGRVARFPNELICGTWARLSLGLE